jgi:hypothetical protein
MPSRSRSRGRGYETGRVTPRKGAGTPAGPSRARASMLQAMSNEKWEVKDSRSVRSGWIWRGFLMLALLAIGVAIIMGANHHAALAVMWLVIAGGWFAVAMWLWRMHGRYMRGE